MYQSLSNFKGEKYSALCNTYPIFEGEKIVGAIEIFQYMEDIDKYMKISLQKILIIKKWMLLKHLFLCMKKYYLIL